MSIQKGPFQKEISSSNPLIFSRYSLVFLGGVDLGVRDLSRVGHRDYHWCSVGSWIHKTLLWGFCCVLADFPKSEMDKFSKVGTRLATGFFRWWLNRPFENISQNGNLPQVGQVGVKIKHIWKFFSAGVLMIWGISFNMFFLPNCHWPLPRVPPQRHHKSFPVKTSPAGHGTNGC